jgi:hypothetical protein
VLLAASYADDALDRAMREIAGQYLSGKIRTARARSRCWSFQHERPDFPEIGSSELLWQLRFDKHWKQRAFAYANDKSQALGEEQVRVPIAEARSRMNDHGRTSGVKIFE